MSTASETNTKSKPTALSSSVTAASPCPCGSGKTYGECCQPILSGKTPAPTAEALMRSRFTAHVVRDYKHLHRSFAGSAKKPYVEETAIENTYDMKWSRLAIHSHEENINDDPNTSIVEFSAYFLDDKKNEHALMERSIFHRTDGQWLYTRAVRTGPAPVKAAPKVGRNDPCPCGSGKKYKQCCGK